MSAAFAQQRSHAETSIVSGERLPFDLTAPQVENLLTRLTSSSEFYARFAADPAAALASIGLPTTLAACLEGKQLASLDSICANRAAIARVLSDRHTTTQHIHNLRV